MRVKANRPEEVKFQAFGYVSPWPGSGRLPPNKPHGSNLGPEALSLAIKNYQEKSHTSPQHDGG